MGRPRKNIRSGTRPVPMGLSRFNWSGTTTGPTGHNATTDTSGPVLTGSLKTCGAYICIKYLILATQYIRPMLIGNLFQLHENSHDRRGRAASHYHYLIIYDI